jgi:hypothetical protein
MCIASPKDEGQGKGEVFLGVFFKEAKSPKSRAAPTGRESNFTVSWYSWCKWLVRVSIQNLTLAQIISSVKVSQDGRVEDGLLTHWSIGTDNVEDWLGKESAP